MTLTDNKADDLRERLDIINGKITEYKQSLIEVRDAVKGTFVSTEEERKLNLTIANLELLKGEILLRFSGFVLIDRKKLAELSQNPSEGAKE